MQYVKNRMSEVLVKDLNAPEGVNLSSEQRTRIVSMIEELKPGWLEGAE
jgi:hypothetical protein